MNSDNPLSIFSHYGGCNNASNKNQLWQHYITVTAVMAVILKIQPIIFFYKKKFLIVLVDFRLFLFPRFHTKEAIPTSSNVEVVHWDSCSVYFFFSFFLSLVTQLSFNLLHTVIFYYLTKSNTKFNYLLGKIHPYL